MSTKMAKKRENPETRLAKSLKRNEKKIKRSKEENVIPKKEKKNRSQKEKFGNKKRTKKSTNAKIANKKYKLRKMQTEVSEASSDEEDEDVVDEDLSETEDENEIESETEQFSDNDDDDSSSAAASEDEVGSDDDNLMETQPLFSKNKSEKKKKPALRRQKAGKVTESKNRICTQQIEGWEINNQLATKDIDFSQWQTANPARETFFMGPDNYIYHNTSAMKKFVDAIKKKQVDEDDISIPVQPMSKVIAANPRTTFGMTGSRYISQNGRGYRVSPIFYISKEYVS